MQKIRKAIFILICISIISIPMVVLGANEFEEEFDFGQFDEFLKTVGGDINELPNINSRHAVVYDRTSGSILYGKKENEKCKMASTTKILSAIVVLENVENLSDKVTVSAKAGGTGGSRLGLHKDDVITVNDLLYGLLLCSRK